MRPLDMTRCMRDLVLLKGSKAVQYEAKKMLMFIPHVICWLTVSGVRETDLHHDQVKVNSAM